MTTHKVKWQGKDVSLNLHSEPDNIARMAMEAFIERSLEVYEDTRTDDPIMLSQYNKGVYCFLVQGDENSYRVDYFTMKDYEKNNLPEEVMKEAKFRMEMIPVRMSEQRAFMVSDRKMPW